MYLIIANAQTDKSILALGEQEKIIKKIEKKRTFHESENLLFLIDKLLKSKKIKPEKLNGIIVIIGPGSFTALHIACTIANSFAYANKTPLYGFKQTEYNKLEDLLIKVKSNKSQESLEPFYGKEPNITKPKKK